jgi:hypothetical protein
MDRYMGKVRGLCFNYLVTKLCFVIIQQDVGFAVASITSPLCVTLAKATSRPVPQSSCD